MTAAPQPLRRTHRPAAPAGGARIARFDRRREQPVIMLTLTAEVAARIGLALPAERVVVHASQAQGSPCISVGKAGGPGSVIARKVHGGPYRIAIELTAAPWLARIGADIAVHADQISMMHGLLALFPQVWMKELAA